jgi:hypothetical protein
VPTKQFFRPDLAPDPSGGWGFHWNGSFWSIYQVGKANGESMMDLLKANGIPGGGPATRVRPAPRLAVGLAKGSVYVTADGRRIGEKRGARAALPAKP